MEIYYRQKKYFQAWIDKNIDYLAIVFSEDIIYSECYGPEYHGLKQIFNWFHDWNKIRNYDLL